MQQFSARRLLQTFCLPLTPSSTTTALRCLSVSTSPGYWSVPHIPVVKSVESQLNRMNLSYRKLTTKVNNSGSEKRTLHQYQPNWSEHTLTISCCPDLYIPKPGGINMNVVYIDTGYDLPPKENTEIATVVLVHGSGQTHRDLLSLAENLAHKGFRVVMPTFPGMGLTKSIDGIDNKMYGHTLEENMDFLGNFIHFLGIDKVDLMIGHSSTCYTLSSLVTFLQNVDGYVFICPGTGPEAPKGIQPYWLFQSIVWLWENTLFWPIVAVAIKLLAISIKRDALPNDLSSAILVIQTLVGARLHLTPKLAIMLRETQMPLLYCFTSRDPVVTEKQYMDHADLNGINSFDVYDKQLNLIEEGQRDFSQRFNHGVKFEMESHQPMQSAKHREILVKHIMEIFQHNQQNHRLKIDANKI